MAKGFSTFQQVGLIDGRKYYRVKGISGIVSSSQNPNMGARIKTDEAFANVRLNCAEFGACSSTAGAIIRSLSEHWRYILKPYASGILLTQLQQVMRNAGAGEWGQRCFPDDNWWQEFCAKITDLSKNVQDGYTGIAITTNQMWTPQDTNKVVVTTNSVHNDALERKGFEGVRLVVLNNEIKCSAFNSSTGKYDKAYIASFQTSFADCKFGTSNTITNEHDSLIGLVKDSFVFGAIIALPYKTIQGKRYYMQNEASIKAFRIGG